MRQAATALLSLAALSPLLSLGCRKSTPLADLQAPSLSISIPAPDARPGEVIPGVVLEVGVANGPPCAKMNAKVALATLGGQPLGEVRAAGQEGDSFSRSGPHCVGPLFNGAAPGPGTVTASVHDASTRLEMDVVDLGATRTLSISGELRAGAEANVVWLPAGDRFDERSPPRVSFVYAKSGGADKASWELDVKSARAEANHIRFIVPANAPAGAGTLYVTAWGDWPEVAPPIARCDGPRLCLARVRLRKEGISVAATVVAAPHTL